MGDGAKEKADAALIDRESDATADGGASTAAAGQKGAENPWRKLSGAQGLQEVSDAWAPLMAEMLPGSDAIYVFSPGMDGGALRPIASWPHNRLPSRDGLGAAETAIARGAGVVRGAGPDGGAGPATIATPLTVGETTLGAAVLELSGADRERLRAAMRGLQWGAAWLRDALRADLARSERMRGTAVGHALHVVVAAAEHEGYAAACRSAATEMATRFSCDRAAVGWRSGGRSRVRAISHSAEFSKRMNLVRQIAASMDEAIDQRTVVQHPDPAADEAPAEAASVIATGAAAALARSQGAGHVLTAPLYAHDRYVGAITLERPEGQPFTTDEAVTIEAVATTLAPVLDEKRRNDRWLVVKLADVIAEHVRRLLGPGRTARKLLVAAALALSVFFYFAYDDYRVTADAAVEGAVQRTIASPFDGFIAQAPARAGDEFAEGDLLVRLDDRDLALERLRLLSERRRRRFEYEQAVAGRNRTEARIKQTQITQTEAQIELVDERIKRSRLVAPFDGLVVSGDLSQSLGAAVARGAPLLEVAPTAAYRVAMRVDERLVADVEVGQQGVLLVSALPNDPFRIEVSSITPVAEYRDGQTTFRIEATFLDETARLRPGMEGAAKIEIDRRRLIAIWTKPLIDWARLWSWRWLSW